MFLRSVIEQSHTASWLSFLLRCTRVSRLWRSWAISIASWSQTMTQQWQSTWERQNIGSSPSQLPSAMAGSEVRLISLWKKEKAMKNTQRLLDSRELTHQPPTEGATLPTQACDNTCSSSSSAFRLDPFTVIYGALTTVKGGGAVRTAWFHPEELAVPARGSGRRDRMSVLHSLLGAKETRTTETEKLHKGVFLQFPRVNLTVTKHAPELIWATKLEPSISPWPHRPVCLLEQPED